MSHMRGIRLCGAFALCALSLTACAEFYPRFDSLLNPDIRDLRSVEVVDGVRCAVTSFLRERYLKINKQADIEARSHQCRTSGKDWNIKYIRQSKDENCVATTKLSEMDAFNCSPAYYAWSYERYQAKSDIDKNITGQRNCVPNGGCVPGTIPRGNGSCVIQDSSRFALDPNSNATIELSLTANNTGSMNYTRIDTERIGWLEHYIAAGNQPPGTPFPSVQIKSKASNIVNIQLVMPQSPYIKEDSPTRTPKD